MREYGQIKMIKFPNKTDCHPKKKEGWKNWWEVIAKPLSRSRMKMLLKKELKEEGVI